MNNSVDDGFAQGVGFDHAFLQAALGGNFGEGAVFHIQFVENPLGSLDQTAVTVLIVFNQVNPVNALVFGDLDGCSIGVGKEIGGIIVKAVGGAQFQRLREIVIEFKPGFLIKDFQLLERQLLLRGTDQTDGVAGTFKKKSSICLVFIGSAALPIL